MILPDGPFLISLATAQAIDLHGYSHELSGLGREGADLPIDCRTTDDLGLLSLMEFLGVRDSPTYAA